MWSFARNVRYKHETSLAFSLPVDVGQGDLLLRFWQWSGSLESFVYRKTRYGAFSWRVGTNVSLARRHRRDDDDRLAIVRALISATPPRLKDDDDDGGGGGGIVSQLKASLATDRTLRYEDTISLRANIRYPLMMEDRQSIELWPLPLDLERELIEREDDTSDNNLGITFDHRLSLRANVCERCSLVMIPQHSGYDDEDDISYCHSLQCSSLSAATMTDIPTTRRRSSVRVSLRASLNEYHEASYHFEMECEEENEEDSVERRRARHDAIAIVFRDVALPMLTIHWPNGLMRECVPYTPELTTLKACRTPIRMTSGRSYFTRERLLATLSSVSGDAAAAAAATAAAARLKYDGEQTFGWYAMGEFWVDSEANTIDSITRDLLCGLYIYQLERERQRDVLVDDDYDDDRRRPLSSKQPTTDRRRAAVITEVAFFISHRHIVTMNGGGALPRQIEVPENAYSIEQRTPETAYILASSTTTAAVAAAADVANTTTSASFWDDLLSLLLPPPPPPSSSSSSSSSINMRHRYITTCFFHTCSKWPVSYVAAATSNPNAPLSPRPWSVEANMLKAPSLSMRYRLSLGKLTRDLFAKRQQHHRRRLDDAPPPSPPPPPPSPHHDDIMHSWLSVDCSTANDNYGGLLERALIPLTLEYSLHFLRRMHEAIVTSGRRGDSTITSSSSSSQISVSRTYALPTELAQLRDHYHRATTAAVSRVGNTDRPFKLDGVLLVRRDRNDRDGAGGTTMLRYEKLKLYQTIEVFVKRGDPLALCSRDRGTFAAFHSIVSPDMSLWRCAAVVDTDSDIDDGRFLVISDLPIPVVNNGRIAELEFRGARSRRRRRRRHNYDNERRNCQRDKIILRFVRWRDDKEHCDKFVKIANILRNQ